MPLLGAVRVELLLAFRPSAARRIERLGERLAVLERVSRFLPCRGRPLKRSRLTAGRCAFAISRFHFPLKRLRLASERCLLARQARAAASRSD